MLSALWKWGKILTSDRIVTLQLEAYVEKLNYQIDYGWKHKNSCTRLLIVAVVVAADEICGLTGSGNSR